MRSYSVIFALWYRDSCSWSRSQIWRANSIPFKKPTSSFLFKFSRKPIEPFKPIIFWKISLICLSYSSRFASMAPKRNLSSRSQSSSVTSLSTTDDGGSSSKAVHAALIRGKILPFFLNKKIQPLFWAFVGFFTSKMIKHLSLLLWWPRVFSLVYRSREAMNLASCLVVYAKSNSLVLYNLC